MAIEVRQLEWQNHNAQRAYPLTAGSTRLDTTGAFRLPDDFLVGLYLTVSPGVGANPGGFYIYKIGAFASGYSVTIGYNGEPVASALIAAASHTKGQYYSLGGLGNFIEATGHVVIGSLDNIDKQPAGQFEFDETGALLEVDCIRPDIRSVTSIAVQNGSAVSDPFYGHIVIRAGTNVRITPTSAGGQTTFTFDAIEGEGLNEECVCIGDDDSQPIYTINGIPPTPDGDFSILGGACIEIEGVTNGIKLKDKCAKPCCGCTELEIIMQAVETMAAQLNTLGQFLAGLEGATTETQGNLIASKLGDRGCNACEEATDELT